jgi:hypothetical protein
MNDLSGLGLPLRSSAVIWEKGRLINHERVLRTIDRELRTWYGAQPVPSEAGLRATLPLAWFDGPILGNARSIEIRVHKIDHAFQLVVKARTTGLVPLLTTIGTFIIAVSLHTSALLSPLIGGAVGLATWGQEWLAFNRGVRRLTDRCDNALDAGGA